MNRRGFLGSLAALIAARHVKPAEAAQLPVERTGFCQVISDNPTGTAYEVWSTTQTTGASTSYIYINAEHHANGEGISWSYTL